MNLSLFNRHGCVISLHDEITSILCLFSLPSIKNVLEKNQVSREMSARHVIIIESFHVFGSQKF